MESGKDYVVSLTATTSVGLPDIPAWEGAFIVIVHGNSLNADFENFIDNCTRSDVYLYKKYSIVI